MTPDRTSQDAPAAETHELHLRDGSEWAEHEDCIIGNEAGLLALRAACDIALAKGEYYGPDLGDWVGVKRLASEWFRAPHDSANQKFWNLVLGTFLLAIFLLVVAGLYTVAAWISHLVGMV